MTVACARHILVATEEEASSIKQQIVDGADFGQMVREFNDVCFSEAVGVVHGPVKTQFGYHLIEVTRRED